MAALGAGDTATKGAAHNVKPAPKIKLPLTWAQASTPQAVATSSAVPKNVSAPKTPAPKPAPAPAAPKPAAAKPAAAKPASQPVISGIPENMIITEPMPPTGANEVERTAPSAAIDPMYQAQRAQLDQALQAFAAQQQLRRSQYSQQFGDQLRDMGWGDQGWDPTGRGTYGLSFRDNEGDFAGRGAYWSGQYANAVDDMNASFDQQKTGMERAKERYFQTLDQEEQNMRMQNQATLNMYLMEAANRIANRYDLDLQEVPGLSG